MEIRTDEISSIIRQQIETFDVDLHVDEVGTVLEVGDGIARVYGLRNVMASEMVEFENGSAGLALNLEEDSVGVVILGDYLDIREGQTVKRTGRVLSVPAGEGLIGRVVNPLSQPIDGKGPIESVKLMPIEGRAPTIADRQPVTEPLMTGIKAIDAMIPIGRGQRELIIGDRETGKSSIAIDAILNQKGTGVICVYVAIGQKASTVAGVVEILHEHGAMDYTIVVAAMANDPAPHAVHRSLRRVRHGRVLHVRAQPAHALHLRRPVEAGGLVPPAVAAAAPPAGPRGLPRRRVLPAQPAARALRQAPRPPRRRLDDGPADHRDAGRRRVGVHPDQRHLHHRRADLPRARPLLRRCAPRRERGHLGEPGGWQRPDEGHEEGGRQPAPRPRAVPRAGGVRAVRQRPRRRRQGPAGPRRAHRRAAQADHGRHVVDARAGGSHVRHRPGAHGRRAGRGHQELRAGHDRVAARPAQRGAPGHQGLRCPHRRDRRPR